MVSFAGGTPIGGHNLKRNSLRIACLASENVDASITKPGCDIGAVYDRRRARPCVSNHFHKSARDCAMVAANFRIGARNFVNDRQGYRTVKTASGWPPALVRNLDQRI